MQHGANTDTSFGRNSCVHSGEGVPSSSVFSFNGGQHVTETHERGVVTNDDHPYSLQAVKLPAGESARHRGLRCVAMWAIGGHGKRHRRGQIGACLQVAPHVSGGVSIIGRYSI